MGKKYKGFKGSGMSDKTSKRATNSQLDAIVKSYFANMYTDNFYVESDLVDLYLRSKVYEQSKSSEAIVRRKKYGIG